MEHTYKLICGGREYEGSSRIDTALSKAQDLYEKYQEDVFLRQEPEGLTIKCCDSHLEALDISAPLPEKEPARQYHFMALLHEKMKKKIARDGRLLTACVVTYGCQMNARDSEKLEGILENIGYAMTDSEDADFVIYNTCTVRENADLRVYGRLGQMKHIRKKRPDMILAVCGCMMQEDQAVEKIKSSYRHVDIIFGTHNIFRLAELIFSHISRNEPVIDIWKDTDMVVEDLPVDRKYPFKTGINITFGCDNFCSYCIVPYVRGRERSRDPKAILREIERAVADGVVEVMLLGQNVNSYGKGLAEPVSFADLLREVEKIDGLKRIRFMTSHPKDLSDDLIQVMSQSKKICSHIHLPLQSGSSRVLAKMNRKYTKDRYLALTERIRAACPDISITTDIIVGFPGETEEDFQETLDVVDRVGFDSAFTFIYSKRSGTPAASYKDQVPDPVIHDRFDRLLALVQEKSAQAVSRFQGRTLPVLVESINDHDPSMVTGRLDSNILVHFKGSADLIGSICPVKLTECHGFYYTGEIVKK